MIAFVQVANQYCCCDDGNTCSDNITALNSTHSCITSECETYIVVHLIKCPNNMSCTTIMKVNISDDISSALSSLVFQIPFDQSTVNDKVRTNQLITKENKLC